MLPSDLQERIRLAKANRCNGRPANCRGTALYLAGLVKQERSIDSCVLASAVKNLRQLEQPEVPCLVLFVTDVVEGRGDRYCPHAGVLVGTDPLRLAHRITVNGRFFKAAQLDVVLRQYPYAVQYWALP